MTLLLLMFIINFSGFYSTKTDYVDDEALSLEYVRRRANNHNNIFVAPPHQDMNQDKLQDDYGLSYNIDYMYDEDEIPIVPTTKTAPNYEPRIPPRIENFKDKQGFERKIECDSFTSYAANCTKQSALMYNSSRKSPPMPGKMGAWCRAIRHLTNCAVDWNTECRDVTESHFNEESIKGHMHVVNNICDDEYFLTRYDELPQCIDTVSKAWEQCYVTFKSTIEDEKNLTIEWTHYETHFRLCCARARFRRCTLDALFVNAESKCDHDDALMLQKFSIVVSEGDVFQDCESNMMFANCPGGDPRPSTNLLAKLRNTYDQVTETMDPKSVLKNAQGGAHHLRLLKFKLVVLIFLINLLS